MKLKCLFPTYRTGSNVGFLKYLKSILHRINPMFVYIFHIYLEEFTFHLFCWLSNSIFWLLFKLMLTIEIKTHQNAVKWDCGMFMLVELLIRQLLSWTSELDYICFHNQSDVNYNLSQSIKRKEKTWKLQDCF